MFTTQEIQRQTFTDIFTALKGSIAPLITLTDEEAVIITPTVARPVISFPLFDAANDAAREEMILVGLRSLVARGLIITEELEKTDQGTQVTERALGELSVILEARSQPSLILNAFRIFRDEPTEIVVFGVGDEGLLVEVIDNLAMHHFYLASPEVLASMLEKFFDPAGVAAADREIMTLIQQTDDSELSEFSHDVGRTNLTGHLTAVKFHDGEPTGKGALQFWATSHSLWAMGLVDPAHGPTPAVAKLGAKGLRKACSDVISGQPIQLARAS